MRTKTVMIPWDTQVTYERVRIPQETQRGINYTTVMEIRFSGQRYQALEGNPRSDGAVVAMDLSNGDIVRLRRLRIGGD